MTQIPHDSPGNSFLAGPSALAEKARSVASGLNRRWQAQPKMPRSALPRLRIGAALVAFARAVELAYVAPYAQPKPGEGEGGRDPRW